MAVAGWGGGGWGSTTAGPSFRMTTVEVGDAADERLSKQQFAHRTMGMISRTHTCPIVYEVIEELKKSLGVPAPEAAVKNWCRSVT